MKTYRVCCPNKNEKTGKTFWAPIGKGWEREGRISIALDAHPIGRDLVLFIDDGQRPAAKTGPSKPVAEEEDIPY